MLLQDSASGLDAYLYQGLGGQYTLAVRGTTDWPDYIEDGWVLPGLIPPKWMDQCRALRALLDEQGAGKPAGAPGILAGKTFNVTGHSLGGYLAAAVHTYYGASVVPSAYLFNAPGAAGVVGSLLELNSPAPVVDTVFNVISSEGFSVTAGLGSEPGAPTSVQIEHTSSIIEQHSITSLVNALLVASAYQSAFPSMTLDDINRVLDACGKTSSGALEEAAGYLKHCVLGGPVQSPAIGEWLPLYQMCSEVMAALPVNTAAVVLAGRGSAALLALAQQSDDTGAAVRHALENGSPVAFVTPHTTTGQRSFDSLPYWQERVDLLLRKMWLAENAKPFMVEEPPAVASSPYLSDLTHYLDLNSGTQVLQGGSLLDSPKVVLGANAGSNELWGGSKADRLYSGLAAETLRGGAGDDRLEAAGGLDVLQGGAGADRLVGSAYQESYLFQVGDGQDKVWTRGGGDVLQLVPGEASLTSQDVSFVRVGLDLAVVVGGEADTVTLVDWFKPGAHSQRLGQVTLGERTWVEAEVTQLALNPSHQGWFLLQDSTYRKVYVREHADGSATHKTVWANESYEVAFVSAPPVDADPLNVVRHTYYYNADGTLRGEREDREDGYRHEFLRGDSGARLFKGYLGQETLTVSYYEGPNGPAYDIRTEARVGGILQAWVYHGTTAGVPITEQALLSLPWRLDTTVTREVLQLARDVKGYLAVGAEQGPLTMFAPALLPSLQLSDGSALTEADWASAPLWLRTDSGAVLGDQVGEYGVLLDSSLSAQAPQVYCTPQGEVLLEWPAGTSANTVSVTLPAPSAGQAWPEVTRWDGTVLETTTWAQAPVRVPAQAGEVHLGLPAGGLTVVLGTGLDFDAESTSIVQHVNDLHLAFEDGTQLVLIDWALRPAALTLKPYGGPAWDAAAVAARIQGYVGDETDNVYTVLTATGQWVLGGDGNDVLWGGAVAGTDTLDGQAGDDRLYGRGGDDILIGGPDVDFLDGGDGNDTLHGSGQDDQLWGQAGNDHLYGGEGNDRIYGNAGDDQANGGAGNDLIAGGEGNDTLRGDEGDDDLFGGAGNDSLYGGSGVNRLYGDAGDDQLWGGLTRNILSGGAGSDVLNAQGAYDELYGGGGFDTHRLSAQEGSRRFIFEDAEGGVIDLSAYAAQGIGVSVQKTSVDQLVLSTTGQETLVVNGWGYGTTSLTDGVQTWGMAELIGQPSVFELFPGVSS